MGVRVSTSSLASAVANCGAAGTIASVGLFPDTDENREDVPASSRRHLVNEIKRARTLTDGVVGVNIMVALSNYEDLVRASAAEGTDFVVSGAGVPLSLPEYTEGLSTKLIPLIASARGANVILKTWKRRYNRCPDAIVVEGPLSGGHIAGYSLEELKALKGNMSREPILETEVKKILELVAEYEKDCGVKIPVIAAGGIFDGKDIAKFLKLGAEGLQIGTRFIATNECSAADNFKQLYVDSKEEDLVYIQSPVGLPAKVIRTKFLEDILRGERKDFNCDYQCLRTCNPSTAQYCIAKALIDAVDGNLEHAIAFASSNVSRITKIIPVQELIDELVSEAVEELDN